MTDTASRVQDDPRIPSDLAAATILLVDDNAQNLELIQAYLEDLPCRIETAADGVEAIEHIDRDPPDMILLDVMMPRMSGFQVCQRVKSNSQTRDIVVIMVTALHEVGDVERAIESGTDDFITKPINKLELLTRVRSLLELGLLRRRQADLLALDRNIGLDTHRPEAGEKLE
jgi:two-component system cell cycle response regulator